VSEPGNTPAPAGDRKRQRSDDLPVGSNLAPLRLVVVLLAIAVVAFAGFTALAAMQRPDDGGPRTATERALMDARRAIEDNPRDVEARLQLARVYIGMGQTETAIRTLEAAKELAPEDLRLTHLLGLAHLEGGDATTALLYLEQAVEFEGGFGDDYSAILSDIGRARTLQGDLEGAAAAYERALVYSPQAADIVFELAVVYEELGRIEEATAAYEGVIKFVPDHEKAAAALARLRSTD